MSQRTDIHRPGAIQPDRYLYCFSYQLPGMDPLMDPPWNLDTLHTVLATAQADGTAVFGGTGKCGVCGASFRNGDLWKHVDSGDLVHLGHNCADKYGMLADRADFCAHLEAAKRNRAARIEAERRQVAFDSFCSAHEGLAEAFAAGADHPIVADIRRKLREYGSISDKQIALVHKLAAESKLPPPEPERHVPAPVGDARVKVSGVVVGKKWHDNGYGETLKLTVKVETPDGTWLCWGSAPSKLGPVDRGDTIAFEAKLEGGDTPHFAFFKRPTKAEIVARAAAAEVTA